MPTSFSVLLSAISQPLQLADDVTVDVDVATLGMSLPVVASGRQRTPYIGFRPRVVTSYCDAVALATHVNKHRVSRQMIHEHRIFCCGQL